MVWSRRRLITTPSTADGLGADATSENNSLLLDSLRSPALRTRPSVTPLAERRMRVRRQGLALRVTRLLRGHDAAANRSFCHVHVFYGGGQERRATSNENVPRTQLEVSLALIL